MNDGNLIPQDKRTESERREIARKGGLASGAARRKKASIQNALRSLLEGRYTSEDGEEVTGYDKIALRLFKTATEGKDEDARRAVDQIAQLMSWGKDDLDRKEQRAKIRAMEPHALTEGETTGSVSIVLPYNFRDRLPEGARVVIDDRWRIES